MQPCGQIIRMWRQARKRSQLSLALEAEVSQRHLSFIESGRSLASREMLLQLARVLEMPMREQNHLLLAGGYAPVHPDRPVTSPDMTAVRKALTLMLAHHEPYPAIVVDSVWDILQSNQAWDRWTATLGDDLWHRIGGKNALRLTFHPLGLQPLIGNWPTACAWMLERLQREAAQAPGNLRLRELLDEVVTWTGAPPPPPWSTLPPPVLELEIGAFKVFSMLSTFGTALDATAEELRVELFFPSDAASEAYFQGNGPSQPT